MHLAPGEKGKADCERAGELRQPKDRARDTSEMPGLFDFADLEIEKIHGVLGSKSKTTSPLVNGPLRRSATGGNAIFTRGYVREGRLHA